MVSLENTNWGALVLTCFIPCPCQESLVKLFFVLMEDSYCLMTCFDHTEYILSARGKIPHLVNSLFFAIISWYRKIMDFSIAQPF